MKLFHATPIINAGRITLHGVDPAFSQGKQNLSWWCDEKRITRALTHASWRHDVSTFNLVIFSAQVDPAEVRPTRWAGIYTCGHIVEASTVQNASDWLATDDAQL